MTPADLLYRVMALALRLGRTLMRASSYQMLCERCARTALREMGIGTTNEMAVNGELAFARSLPRGSTVFDVGAHAGAFASAVLEEVPGASLHCFEPLPEPFRKLQRVPGIVANNFALGDESRTATIYSDKPSSELSSLTRRRLDHFGIRFEHAAEIMVDTLDAYCLRNGVERIDLLKVDVEGHELAVLRGARRLFERGAIHRVLFEFGGTGIDSRVFLQDYYYFFTPMGMKLHRLLRDGSLHPIPQYEEFYEQFTYTNFVALSPVTSIEQRGAP
jgi:FkbM family methyltransferase